MSLNQKTISYVSARLEPTMKQRLDIACAMRRISKQDAMAEALALWLVPLSERGTAHIPTVDTAQPFVVKGHVLSTEQLLAASPSDDENYAILSQEEERIVLRVIALLCSGRQDYKQILEALLDAGEKQMRQGGQRGT